MSGPSDLRIPMDAEERVVKSSTLSSQQKRQDTRKMPEEDADEEEEQELSSQNPTCFLYGPGDARFEDRPVPELQDPHDVLIRPSFIGVCGSDVHFWTEGGIGDSKIIPSCPVVMGHESSGIISSIGPSVTNLAPGDHVAIEPGYGCRRCTACRSGNYHFCPGMKFAACPPDDLGALAKYFRLPEDCCYKLPEGVGLQEGALVEPLAVAVHVARMAGIAPGQSVTVMGAGTIGLLCAAVAKAHGAMTVIAVDILPKRLDFARDYAATHTFLPDLKASAKENAEKLLRGCGLEDGGGVDVVLECSGAEASIQTGMHVLKMGGQYVQAGLGRPKVEVPIVALSEKEIHVHGSYRYGAGDFDMAIGLLKMGKVSLKELISSVLPFERATEAWERTKRGEGIKNLIRGVED